jgi:phenylacetic acid degradation operon negative regulatory protein
VDPELPQELAPLSGPRGRAVATFHELYEGLAEPSQRHFEAVTAAFAEVS